MTQAVAQIVNQIQHLSAEEQQEIREVLGASHAGIEDFGDLTDEELTAAAAQTMIEIDRQDEEWATNHAA